MPTYRQEWSYYEDGFGDTNMVFVVSDTYDGLFATTGVIPTQVFRVGSIKQDLDLSSGEIAADELQLSIDEASIDSPTDEAAVAFFLQAENTDVKRYTALFINTAALPAPPDTTHALFVGLVSNKLKARDLFHGGVAFSSQIEALREWDATCYTFFDQAIADIPLSDLIDGNLETGVVGIDASWVTANVADRQAFHKTDGSGNPIDRSIRWDKLVNLNKLLRKLADNVTATIAARGLGTMDFEIAHVELDARFRPARFTPFAEYDNFKSRLLPTPGTAPKPPANLSGPFVIKESDLKLLSLGDSATDPESPWIHWRMVKPEGKSEESMSIRRCRNFPELIYAVAASFGMFVRFYNIDQNTIEIRFITRSSLDLGACFFRDAQTGSIDLARDEAEASQSQVAVTTLYTPDGSELQPQTWPAQGKSFSTVYREDIGPTKAHAWVMSSDAKKSLFSTGVPLRSYGFRLYDVDKNGRTYVADTWQACVAHNAVWYQGNDREVDLGYVLGFNQQEAELVYKTPIGITNMIYVRTNRIDEPVTPTNTPMWAPIAAISTRVDGEDKTFYSLSMYVNALAKRDQEYYTATYELEIPFINGFSQSEFGGSQSWKNLDLGSTITIQESGQPIDFTVIGIERDMTNISTRVKMHRKSRFTFTAPLALPAITPEFESNNDNTAVATSATSDTRFGIADEAIGTGDAVRAYYNGSEWRLRRMRSHSEDYNSMVGIALNDADVDGRVRVQTTGHVELPTYSFIPGEPVYVRTAVAPAINISQTLLTAVSGAEDMIVDIGTADSTNSFVLNLFEQFILEV